MAGFGKTLLRGLAGAAEGYGDYLTTQGKIQEEERLQDRQSQRAMALEQYRAGIQSQRDEAQDERQRGQMVLQGAINRGNNVAELQQRGANDAANDKREYDQWLAKNSVEFDQWKTKTGIELTNAQKLESFKAQKQAEVKAQEEGLKPVGDDIDEATGTRVLFYRKPDGETRVFDTGVVVQSKSETNPFTGEVTRNTSKPNGKGRLGWRDEQPAATPAAGSPKVATTAMAQSWITEANKKRNAGEAGWKGLTDTQLANRVRDAARSAGYDISSLK